MSYAKAKIAVQQQINDNNSQNNQRPNFIKELGMTAFGGVLSEVGPEADYNAEVTNGVSMLIDQYTKDESGKGAITRAKERLAKKELLKQVELKTKVYEAEATFRKQQAKDSVEQEIENRAAIQLAENTQLVDDIMPTLKVPDNLKNSLRDMLINNRPMLTRFNTVATSDKDIEINFIGENQDYLKGIKLSGTIIGDDGKKYIAYNRTDNVSNFNRYTAKMRSNVVNYLDNKFIDTESREYKAVQNLKETGLVSPEERQLLIPHIRDAVTTRAGIDPELKRSVNAIIAGHTVMNDNIDTQIFKKLDDSLQFTIRNNSSQVNIINSQINAINRSIADAKAVAKSERKQGLEGEISRQERVIEGLQKQKETFQFNIQKAQINVAERTAVKSLLKNRIIARAVADKNLDQLNQSDVVRQYAAEVLQDKSFQTEASSLIKQLQQYGLINRPEGEQETTTTLQNNNDDSPPANNTNTKENKKVPEIKLNPNIRRLQKKKANTPPTSG